jgi:hypothetical protein
MGKVFTIRENAFCGDRYKSFVFFLYQVIIDGKLKGNSPRIIED